MFKLGDVILAKRHVYFPQLQASVEVGEEWPLVVLESERTAIHSDLADLRVAPISDKVSLASDRDLLCSADDGPLGTQFVVELWNQRPMLACNIDRAIGALSADTTNRLCILHNAITGSLPWNAIADEWHGTPIDSATDPRIEHQSARAKQASFLSDPVDELLEDCERRSSPSPGYDVSAVLGAFGAIGAVYVAIAIANARGERPSTPPRGVIRSFLYRVIHGKPSHAPRETGEFPVIRTVSYYGAPEVPIVFGPQWPDVIIRRHALGFDCSVTTNLVRMPTVRMLREHEFSGYEALSVVGQEALR